MRWTWINTCGTCLAAALLATAAAQAQPAAEPGVAPSSGDDRLKLLAEQLAGTATAPAPAAAPAAASHDANVPAKTVSDTVSENERLPLQRGDVPVTRDGQALPTPQWGSGWVLHTVTALGVVILIVFGLRAMLVKLGAAKGISTRAGAVEVLSRTAIAPKNHVLLLRVAGRVLVVGDSTAGLRTLAQIDDPDEVASLLAATTAQSPHSASRGFAGLIGRFNRQFDPGQRALDEGGDETEHTVDRARDGLSSLLARVRATGPQGEGSA